MESEPNLRQLHWQTVYLTKPATSVSWYRPHLDVSLELLSASGMTVDSRIIDIGGGASTLVDDLLARGLKRVSVLDVSEKALEITRKRLGERSLDVTWYVGDVLEVELPPQSFDLWHDRAVLHFLTDPADAARYSTVAAAAVAAGGHAVIGGFAPEGPARCSGLPVARRSADDIAAVMGPAFTLVDRRTEQHRTPSGAVQSFVYALLRRR